MTAVHTDARTGVLTASRPVIVGLILLDGTLGCLVGPGHSNRHRTNRLVEALGRPFGGYGICAHPHLILLLPPNLAKSEAGCADLIVDAWRTVVIWLLVIVVTFGVWWPA